VIGAYIAWFGWTQQARTKQMHAAPYHPPLTLIALGLTAILSLVLCAYLLRAFGHGCQIDTRLVPNPWLTAIAAFLLAGPWWELITLVFVSRPQLPHWIPLAAGVAWAILAFALIHYWSDSTRWSDKHRWSLSFGPVLATIIVGYLSFAGWSTFDLIGRAILNVLAVAGFILLARKIWRRQTQPPSPQ
jgi:hypothetical protein